MFKNYFKIAWRSLIKNKVSSVINIGGLAVGLATSIIIMLVVVDEFSYDKFHANLPNIYLLMKNQKHIDGISTGDPTAGPMAATLRNEMPETNYTARVAYFGDQLTRAGDKIVNESGIYAEPDLFNMMSFPALQGDPVNALKDASSVVITERTAKKLFGTDNPMGKTLVFNNAKTLKVAAVLRDVPVNSTIQFDMVLPFRIFEKENDWLNKWDDNRIQTWVQLKPSVNIPVLNRKLTKLLQVRSADKTVSLFVYPLAKLRLYGGFDNGKPNGGRITMVKLMSILGLFVLLIACINFMNISTARSEHRAREVGVRKVLGASRKLIILQFLCEALLITTLSLVLGVMLAQMVLPEFNQFAEKNIQFNFWDWKIWLLLPGIGLFTGLVAGSYPSLFLSRFKTVRVLKGLMANGKSGGGLRKVLVTLQFIISIFFIVGTIVIYEQINYVRNRPIGYDQENLVDIYASGDLSNKFEILKMSLPGSMV